jgi:hypothetical protein
MADTGVVLCGSVSDSGTNWIDEANLTADDGSYAYVDPGRYGFTSYITAYNFGLSVPSGATIDGIQLTHKIWQDPLNTYSVTNGVRPIHGDTTQATGYTFDDDYSHGGPWGDWPASPTVRTYGTTDDLWGDTWDDTDVNGTNFGWTYRVSGYTTGDHPRNYVDYMAVKVYYTEAGSGPQTVTPGAGSLSYTGYLPNINAEINANTYPGIGLLTYIGYTPSLIPALEPVITPSAGALTLTGYAPVIRKLLERIVTADSGSLSFTGYTPVVNNSIQSISPDYAQFVLAGYAPEILREITANIAGGTLQFTGKTPGLVILTPWLEQTDHSSTWAEASPASNGWVEQAVNSGNWNAESKPNNTWSESSPKSSDWSPFDET